MNPRRLLLITNDSLIAICYGETLAKAGFHVSVAVDGPEGLRKLLEAPPLVIIIDLLLPGMSSSEVITQIRANKATRQLPIIALATELEPLCNAAHAAGLTTHLHRVADPVIGLLRAVEAAIDPKAKTAAPEFLGLSVANQEKCNEELINRLGNLRRSLQKTAQLTDLAPVFKELLAEVHYFCELAFILNFEAVFHMASALESLAFEFDALPEHTSPSAMRTLSQGVDFLALLSEVKGQNLTKSPSRSHVLVVEDDSNARQLIAAAMKMVGLPSSPAATPGEALEILKTTPMDLILLDIGLPEMNGTDLCAQIRTLPLHSKTPIVFLTGMATFLNRAKSSISGGNDFISKPFNLPELGVKALNWVYKGQLTARS